jgi:hypothetical protein
MAHGRSTRRPRLGRPSCKSIAIGTVAVASVLLAAISAQAADKPTLLILPLDMVDTSGEIPSHAQEHEDRLLALAQYLSKALGEDGDYAIVDPTPIRATIDKARATQFLGECNGCERDFAKLVHADRVLIGGIDKVSTLIGSLRLSIIDVATGQRIFSRVLSFRGDTDEAWQHASRFFVRDLEATAAQQR